MSSKKIATFGSKYKIQSDFDEPINLVLREHIDQNEDWEYQAYVEQLHELFVELNEHFFEGRPLPTPSIGVKTLQKNRIGKYNRSRNEFALPHELIFNAVNLPTSDRDEKASGDVPFWYVALEMLHVQMHMGENLIFEAPISRVHTSKFMDTTQGWGITTNKKACAVDDVVEGTFTEWLKMKGIDYSLPYTNSLKQERTPKHRWSCECEEFSIKVEEGKDASVLMCSLCETAFSQKEGLPREKAEPKRKKGAKKPRKTNSKKNKVDVSGIDIGIPASELPSAKEIRTMSVTDLRGLASQFGYKNKNKQNLIDYLVGKIMDDAEDPPKKAKKPKGKTVPKTVAKSATKKASKAKLTPELKGHFEVKPIRDEEGSPVGFFCLHCDDGKHRKSKAGASAHLKSEHPKIKPIAA